MCEQCAEAGGFYCGDDESNWTVYSPNGCVPANYIADGWEDCVDASDEVTGATTDCGDDNGGDPTCEFGITTITYDAAGMWNSENSWTISDADGNIVLTGNGSTSAFSVEACMDPDACYTFSLADSYGDGWNGNSLMLALSESTQYKVLLLKHQLCC